MTICFTRFFASASGSLWVFSSVARSTDFFFRSEEILTNLRFLKNLKKFDRNLKMFFNVSVSKKFSKPKLVEKNKLVSSS